MRERSGGREEEDERQTDRQRQKINAHISFTFKLTIDDTLADSNRFMIAVGDGDGICRSM